MKNQPPLRRRRIEGFGQAAKPDTPYPQGFDGFDQLLHRPRLAIELPHDQRVAAAREFERVMRGKTICNRTRHLLVKILAHPASVRESDSGGAISGAPVKPAKSRWCKSTTMKE